MKLLIPILLLLTTLPPLAAPEQLPLVEVPATGGTSDTVVVFISGDGGWAAIDKAMSKSFAGSGMPVVGFNALQYFWKKRTPDEASRDLAAVLRAYMAKWKKSRVVLAGYSRGADVLPAMANRLSPELQSHVRLIVLLGPSPNVEFEFHMSDWLHDTARGLPVKPEVDRIRSSRILCLWGEDDKDSLCPRLTASNVRVITLKGAHHFDGGYDKLARMIMDELK
ncbi:MAG: AcvB/VirJ family lysyl-phosphatidylglycerol hydrolase [Acidobacteriota bacterium]